MNKGKNEGITLIALVITIIVLLILVGISIGMIYGEDSLIGRTIIARNSTIDEAIKEQIVMLIDEYILDCKIGNIDINDDNQIINWLENKKEQGRMDSYSFDSDERVIGITIDGVTLYYDSSGKEVQIVAYNIEYELNGGTNQENVARTYRKGDFINLPTPTKNNSQFLGWSTNSNNFNSENIISSITSDMEGDLKLYAYWLDELPTDLFTYTTTATSATITGFSEKGIQKYNNGEITNLILPTKYNGLTISSVGGFSGKNKIKKLVIPDSITQINSSAFNGCTGIEYLKIPISTPYATADAFNNVNNIKEIYFSKGTGKGVNYVDNGNQLLHYTYTPWNRSKEKLTKITLESGITQIGNLMFRGCYNIADTWENLINKREELTNIGALAFAGCTNITGELTFPSKITVINAQTFSGCTGITRLIIPETVTSKIQYQAFYGCTGIKYLKIPISLEYSEAQAFVNVNNIEEVYFSKGTGKGVNYVDNGNQVLHYTYTPWNRSKEKLTKITLESGITQIGSQMFRGCYNITDTWENLINKREELTNIGALAFAGCTNITGELAFPSKITVINAQTFSGCTGITRLIIPETVTSKIQYQAFYGCTGIKYLKIPISLEYSEFQAFVNVNNIEEVYFSKGTGIGVNYVDNGNQLLHYAYTPWNRSKEKLTKITLESGITQIGSQMFRGCYNITDTWENLINKREDLTNIGALAFAGCTNITGELTFPSKITVINAYTFSGCTGITRLIIPETVKTSIQNQAFYGCSGIKYLKIPISLGYIDAQAFNGVNNIEEVYFSKGTGIGINYADNANVVSDYRYTPWYRSREKFKKVTLEQGITSIGNLMFRGCYNITDTWENLINKREELTNIGTLAFAGCTNITGELTFPSKITVINAYTFSGCTGITRLIIPDTVTTAIQTQAFYGCSEIKYLKIPISLGYIEAQAFNGVNNIEEVYFSKGTGTGINYANNSNVVSDYRYTPWYRSKEKMTKVTFEKGVASVGNLMFYGSNKISELHYTGTSAEWNSVTIGSNNENITKLTAQCSD